MAVLMYGILEKPGRILDKDWLYDFDFRIEISFFEDQQVICYGISCNIDRHSGIPIINDSDRLIIKKLSDLFESIPLFYLCTDIIPNNLEEYSLYKTNYQGIDIDSAYDIVVE